MKFCKDCAHFINGHPTDSRQPFCSAQQSRPELDAVYGTYQFKSCRLMRDAAFNCGLDARWFNPKPIPAKAPWWAVWRKE